MIAKPMGLSVSAGSLNTKWKELLFSFSGFGPNFLMVLMGAFYSDAVNPAGFMDNTAGQSIVGTICLVVPGLFSVLMLVAKAFDGLIDIPFASVTDNLSTRWGRRRPPIAICFAPMVVSFAMCWLPVFGTAESAQLGNTIWFILWALVFFSTYTMCLISFYGSLSTVCSDEAQRLRVSSFKSFFDTISYCIVYALVPVIVGAMNDASGGSLGMDEFVFMSLPLMFTMIIPLFMIKEGAKYGYPENEGAEKPQKITLGKSLKITFKNKIFRNWLVVNCCSFFGLQMFLVSMNTMIIGGMGMNALEMMMLNTCAFAPVPIMLYLFRKMKERRGLRFTYQTCLLSFALAILGFFFGSKLVCGDNKTVQYIIGCVGGVLGSWAIGSFFMMPYMVPSQISAVEEKLLKRNHSAMYFAAQAFATSIVGAVASYGIYDIIKNIFFTKSGSFVWAEAVAETGKSASQVAAETLGVAENAVYNFGTTLVPFVVAIMCIVGFLFAFRMPRDYNHKEVAMAFLRMDPTLDISEYINEEEPKPEKGEILFVQIGLSVLSGFIFGFIWLGFMLRAIRKAAGEALKVRLNPLFWALGCFIPFVGIYVLIKRHSELAAAAEKYGLSIGRKTAAFIVTGILLPVLPVNVVGLSLMQHDLNRYYAAERAADAAAAPAKGVATADEAV